MEIPIRCQACGSNYTLGRDSIVIAANQTHSDFRFVINSGNSPANSRETPDLIDSFPPETHRDFNSLPTEEQHKQQAQIVEINVTLSCGTTRWWRCRKCGAIQTYKRFNVSGKQFDGRTLEEALAKAKVATLGRKVLNQIVIRDTKQEVITATGGNSEAAIEAAKMRVPSRSFDISSGEIIQKGQINSMEITAFSEDEALNSWKRGVPEGAKLDSLRCVSIPCKGRFGIGNKPGSWKADWSLPFVARITYKTTALVEITCEDTQ